MKILAHFNLFSLVLLFQILLSSGTSLAQAQEILNPANGTPASWNKTVCFPGDGKIIDYTIQQSHIAPQNHIILSLGVAKLLSITCILGNIWDLFSGFPYYNLTLLAPKFLPQARFDLAKYAESGPCDASKSKKTCWSFETPLFNTFSVNNGSDSAVETEWQLELFNHNSFWNLDANISVGVAIQSSSVTQPPPGPCLCEPKQPSNHTDCAWYVTGSNTAWLPTNYAEAAACACSLKGVPGTSSPTARCVRHTVQEMHNTEDYFSSEQKQLFLDAKNKYCGGLVCDGEYRQLLRAMQFSDIAYRLHSDAYAKCCCPNPPAGLWAWELIYRIAYVGKYACPVETHEIEEHGSCGCEGW